jgi:hypothetical protein
MFKEGTFNLEIWKMEIALFLVLNLETNLFNYFMIDQDFLQVSVNKIPITADSH